MPIDSSDQDFWRRNDDGKWESVGSFGETSFSIAISEEVAARLAAVLEPLGDLEIVPRDEE